MGKSTIVNHVLSAYSYRILGNVGGSLLGGRWSDQILARLKAANRGVGNPEMRLKSTTIAMLILPFATLAYGWTCHYHVHVAAPVVALLVAGFTLMWGYSSTLAYIVGAWLACQLQSFSFRLQVDSNPGRAISAVAMNSCFRGLGGLIVAEVSAPIQVRRWFIYSCPSHTLICCIYEGRYR